MITRQPISAADFLRPHVLPECGALASFFGVVRNHHQGRAVLKLDYDCYEPMALRELKKIEEEAVNRFKAASIDLLHRIGPIAVGEIAVAIAVYSAHREEAFGACRYAIEAIKQRVPIWKHEYYTDGTTAWVACHHAPQEVLP